MDALNEKDADELEALFLAPYKFKPIPPPGAMLDLVHDPRYAFERAERSRVILLKIEQIFNKYTLAQLNQWCNYSCSLANTHDFQIIPEITALRDTARKNHMLPLSNLETTDTAIKPVEKQNGKSSLLNGVIEFFRQNQILGKVLATVIAANLLWASVTIVRFIWQHLF